MQQKPQGPTLSPGLLCTCERTSTQLLLEAHSKGAGAMAATCQTLEAAQSEGLTGTPQKSCKFSVSVQSTPRAELPWTRCWHGCSGQRQPTCPLLRSRTLAGPSCCCTTRQSPRGSHTHSAPQQGTSTSLVACKIG